jgi:hypothetical protein
MPKINDALRENGHMRVMELDEINIRSLGTKIAGVNPFDKYDFKSFDH